MLDGPYRSGIVLDQRRPRDHDTAELERRDLDRPAEDADDDFVDELRVGARLAFPVRGITLRVLIGNPNKGHRLRVEWRQGGLCRFGVSFDGREFTFFEQSLVTRPGRWVGAKVGVFAATDTDQPAGEPVEVGEGRGPL